MRRGRLVERGICAAAAFVAAAAIVLGCRGEVDRLFVDDTLYAADGAITTDATADDVSVPGLDSSSPPADAATDGDAKDPDAGTGHKVGGKVLGLLGTGMVLELNGASSLAVAPAGAGADVPFTLASPVAEGASFSVSIKTQPSSPAQACSVGGGTGTMGTADVTTVIVNCNADLFTIGGTLSGLGGTVTLQNKAGNDLLLTSNGSFAFSTLQATATPYDVTVSGHSALPVQSCTVTNGSGNVAGTNVSTVGIACTSTSYTLGGMASGVTGTVVIKNGADTLQINDGSFTFGQPVLSNGTYDVQVVSTPADRSCAITNASGTVTNANVSNLVVTCFPKYALAVEGFDGVAAPVLPAGWTTTILAKTGAPSAFETVTTASPSGSLPASDSAPNSCGVGDHNNKSDIVLESPSFTVSSSSPKLTFRHAYALEASQVAGTTVGYDGVVLEIAIGGGAWTDIVTAGGTWVVGGYSRFLYGDWFNPLGTGSVLGGAGRACWSGTSGGWMTTTVTLPLTVGQSAQIRFREGTDNKNSVCAGPPYCEGWRLDNLSVAN